MRRPVIVSVLLLILVARAGAAPDVGLVVLHAPADASDTVDRARDRVATRARAAGIATVDLSPPARPAPTAPDRLRAGIDAYDELRGDDALTLLDEAAAEAARTGAAGLTTSELSDIYLYRGLVHTQRGDATRAWDDLVRAATIAPARTLDPLRFPPRAVEAFDRARAAVAATSRATITVDAPGCDTWIDGGAATTAEVPHGEHAVRAECAGRAPWGERVVVAGDVTVTPKLEELATPDDAALARLARERGAAELLVVVVAETAGAPPTATLRVVDADGTARRRASVTLGGDRGLADLDAAVDRVLATEAVVVAPPPQRWWRSPWLWAAVGVVATSAIVLPLTLRDDDDGGTATLRPDGWRWE